MGSIILSENQKKSNKLDLLKNSIGFFVSMAILIIVSAAIAVYAYWSLAPVRVLKINKLPVPVTAPEEIQSGRLIFLDFDYCKINDTHGTVERQLIGERSVIILPTYPDTTPKGCNKVKVPTLLPYTITAQKFHIHYKVTYRVNPIRTTVEEFDTEGFTILPIKSLPIDNSTDSDKQTSTQTTTTTTTTEK